MSDRRAPATTSRLFSVRYRRAAAAAATSNVTAKHAMPERDLVSASAAAINPMAAAVNCSRPPSGDDSHTIRSRHPRRPRAIPVSASAMRCPIASGRARRRGSQVGTSEAGRPAGSEEPARTAVALVLVGSTATALGLDGKQLKVRGVTVRAEFPGPPAVTSELLKSLAAGDIAVLASGEGTNLQALLDDPTVGRWIALVVSDRSGARALDRARERGVDAVHLPPTRDDEELVALLRDRSIEVVVLAGFMKVLGPAVIDAYRGRILNGPLLVPVNVDEFVMPRQTGLEQLGYGVAGLTLLLIAAFFIAVFRDGRRSEQFRREFLRRKRRRFEKVLAAGAGAEPAPPREDVEART